MDTLASLPPGVVVDTDVPEWSLDTLTNLRTDGLYDDGALFRHLSGEPKGWHAPVAPRTNRTDRPFGSGSLRAPSFGKERVLVVAGESWCTSQAEAELEAEMLASLCRPGRGLYALRRRGAARDQTLMVERDAQPAIDIVAGYHVSWTMQVAAPDGRKHDTTWQTPISTMPSPGTGGLDFSGLDFAAGLDFGTPGAYPVAQVGNYGTTSAFPVFTISRGALPGFSIVDLNTGQTIGYSGSLAASDSLVINCDGFPHPVTGQPEHTAVLNGVTDVTALLSLGLRWPVVPARGTARYQLQAATVSSAQLMAGLRSAYE